MMNFLPKPDFDDYYFINMQSPKTMLTLTKVSKIKKINQRYEIIYLGKLSANMDRCFADLKKSHNIKIVCFQKRRLLKRYLNYILQYGGWKSCTIIQHLNLQQNVTYIDRPITIISTPSQKQMAKLSKQQRDQQIIKLQQKIIKKSKNRTIYDNFSFRDTSSFQIQDLNKYIRVFTNYQGGYKEIMSSFIQLAVYLYPKQQITIKQFVHRVCQSTGKDRLMIMVKEYTNESFFHKILNNLSRMYSLEKGYRQIFYIQPFIHEMYHGIYQLFQHQLKRMKNIQKIVKFYRGCRLTDNEFQLFQRRQNEYISSLSFLSTSRNQDKAIIFIQNAFITIEVDYQYLSEKQPGFAFVKQLSAFYDENEVLFNINSVFRIKSVEKKEDRMDIVLLYGEMSKLCYWPSKNDILTKQQFEIAHFVALQQQFDFFCQADLIDYVVERNHHLKQALDIALNIKIQNSRKNKINESAMLNNIHVGITYCYLGQYNGSQQADFFKQQFFLYEKQLFKQVQQYCENENNNCIQICYQYTHLLSKWYDVKCLEFSFFKISMIQSKVWTFYKLKKIKESIKIMKANRNQGQISRKDENKQCKKLLEQIEQTKQLIQNYSYFQKYIKTRDIIKGIEDLSKIFTQLHPESKVFRIQKIKFILNIIVAIVEIPSRQKNLQKQAELLESQMQWMSSEFSFLYSSSLLWLGACYYYMKKYKHAAECFDLCKYIEDQLQGLYIQSTNIWEIRLDLRLNRYQQYKKKYSQYFNQRLFSLKHQAQLLDIAVQVQNIRQAHILCKNIFKNICAFSEHSRQFQNQVYQHELIYYRQVHQKFTLFLIDLKLWRQFWKYFHLFSQSKHECLKLLAEDMKELLMDID